MIVKKALEKDAEKIVSINIETWNKTYNGIFSKNVLEDLYNKKQESIKKCKQNIKEYVVCKDNNEIIGFARYGKNKKSYPEDYAEIYALYVKEEYQNKYAGTCMINYIKEKLKKEYNYLLISTLKENNANLFYQKQGGIKIDETVFKLENSEYIENLYKFDLKEES